MRLKPYADTAGRRSVQLLADLFMIAWVVVWVWIGRFVRDAVAAFAQVGYTLHDGAAGIGQNLQSAGSGAGRVPLIGGALGSPLTGAGHAADNVADAGRRLGEGIDSFAVLLALLVAGPAIVSVLAIWSVLRLRYAYRAGAAADLATSPAGERLLALRALARRPLRRLRAVDPDPVEAWRRNDPAVVHRLAVLELSRTGLRSRRR